MSKELGGRIRELRKENGYPSMEALARKIGVSFVTVSSWERGLSTPNLVNIYLLAAALGVTVDELLGNNGKEAA